MKKIEDNQKENIVPLFLRGTQIGAIILFFVYIVFHSFSTSLIWPAWIVITEILIRYLRV